MKAFLTILAGTFSIVVLHAQPSEKPAAKNQHTAQQNVQTDFLYFDNGDTLHGEFVGFDKKSNMLWKSPEALDPICFSTGKITRIVRNRGLGHKQAGLKSTVLLTNGDVLPGSVLAADKTKLVFESIHMGELTIPMDVISEIQLNPYGGDIFYQGPFSPEDWKIIHPLKPEAQGEDKEGEQEEHAPEPDDPLEQREWNHIANSWYSGSEQSCLALENAVPDRCRLRFKLAWRGSRLYTGIAIHADLDAAPRGKNPHLRTNFAATLGNAYVLVLSSNYVALQSCSFDEEGNPVNERIGQSVSLDLNARQEAVFEIRADRHTKQLLLYIDGAYRTNWDLGDQYTGKGNAFVISKIHNNTDLRLSDMVISKWNGIKDSAQSMTSRKRDVILLCNGLDRFSGTFEGLKNGIISFSGSYENRINVPQKEVEQLKFATEKARKNFTGKSGRRACFLIPPHGRITGIPQCSYNNQIKISSELLGEFNLDMRYISMIEFSDQNRAFDIWNEHF